MMVGAMASVGLKAETQPLDTVPPAGDFTYVASAAGTTDSLYGLRAPRVLVYFYDPTCEDCEALRAQLAASDTINRLIDEGQLQVLAVYPDNDSTTWADHAPHLPARWINGYDRDLTVMRAEGFLFSSLPALYLLDAERRFLLREATEAEAVEKELMSAY